MCTNHAFKNPTKYQVYKSKAKKTLDGGSSTKGM